MTRSELFKTAHKMTKTFTGDYRARFALALKLIREGVSEMMTAKELNEKFNVNVKRWEARIEEAKEELDVDYVDAAFEIKDEIKFKKDFIFVEIKNGAKNSYIHCIGNSFSIKEELANLGFVYGFNHPQGGTMVKGWNLAA